MATPNEIQQIATGTRVQLTSGAGGITVGSLILGITDCQAYKELEFQIISTAAGTGAIQVQESHDATFANFDVVTPRRLSGVYNSIGAAPAGQYTAPILARYVRIIVTTAYSSGTCTGTIYAVTSPLSDGSAAFKFDSLGNAKVASTTPSNSNVVDINAVAITATGTTVITPTAGTSYAISLDVTAVTGTTPSFVLNIQESMDGGVADWRTIYTFPTITGTGVYDMPLQVLSGTKLRYNYTVAGTTPSFTVTATRVQSYGTPSSITTGTYNSTAPVLTSGSTSPLQLDANGNLHVVETPNASVVDVNAVAVTASGNSAVISPTFGSSYSLSFNVTAVTGTTPGLTINVQESIDGGVNDWTTVNSVVISAIGIYDLPLKTMVGSKIRYNYVVSGTTPSFTLTTTRTQSRGIPSSISVTGTYNSTPALNANGTVSGLSLDAYGNLRTANLNNQSVVDVNAATISSTGVSATFAPVFGTSYAVSINVASTTGVLYLTIQESMDGGVSDWKTVYYVTPIFAPGVYDVPLLPVTGNLLRYHYNVAGGPFVLTITRSQSYSAPITQGVYNANQESLVDGQTSPLQLDANGNLHTVLPINSTVLDVGSLTVNSNSNTAYYLPTFGTSYAITLNVSSVTGTSPTMTFAVQESIDFAADDWVTVNTITGIAATGIYSIPLRTLAGNKIRYSFTVGGTTPSFVVSVSRLQSYGTPASSALTTGTYNSTAPTLTSGSTSSLQLDVNGNLHTTLPSPQVVQDVNAAVITTTGTSSWFTPTFGTSYVLAIEVSAASGTTPSIVIAVQEALDNTPTDYITTYTFTAITATGNYNMPLMSLTGSKIRYSYTVTGTTPSFTLSIFRTQSYTIPASSVTGTYNSVTPVLTSGQTSGLQVNSSGNLLSVPPVNVGIVDVNAVAITASGNSATITPTAGTSYSVSFNVTAVTGTTPTLAIAVQESIDGSSDWRTIYTFATITAIGIYDMSLQVLSGTKLRYNYTVTGTTPSFTLTATRVQSYGVPSSSTVGTYNSTTPVLTNGSSSALQLDINGNLKTNLPAPTVVQDVNAAVITTTGTSSWFTPTAGTSYVLAVEISAVSGTTPSMVIAVQEALDSTQTDYVTTYTFSPISANGNYNTPIIAVTGSKIRYSYTVTGTTPSFTANIYRTQLFSTPPVTASTPLNAAIVDVNATAITASGNSGAITPTAGTSYAVSVDVTAVTGTTPTISIAIQESIDGGVADWRTVNTFPTISTTGVYDMPLQAMSGTKLRYLYTVTGTTPSFTLTITRVQSYAPPGISAIVQGNAAFSDLSGTITTANTAQTLAAANTSRAGWRMTNKSSSIIYVNELTVATGGNADYPVQPGETYPPPGSPISTAAISIYCSQAGAVFQAQQWNTPTAAASTLFVTGATPGGQAAASASYPVVAATNYTESVPTLWQVLVAGTGYSVGNLLQQTIKSNGGTVSQTWFNLTQGTIITTPTAGQIASNLLNVSIMSLVNTTFTDVASAAITSTANSSAFIPTWGSAYSVELNVTAVTGTTPTMIVVIQESVDGTNWFNVFTFPTISSSGVYQSPLIQMTGSQIRYSQTLTGTSPSFTRTISRVQSNAHTQTAGNCTTYPVSGSITTGGTAQTVNLYNPARKVLEFQNTSNGVLWIAFGQAAAIGTGFQVQSNSMYTTPINCPNLNYLSVYGATTGQTFSVGEM